MPDALPDLDDAAYQRALAVLLDVGTSLVLELKPSSTEITLPTRANAFVGVSYAVRRTILLSRHIAEAIPARAERQAKQTLARKQVIRAVEDAIERARPTDAGSLRIELLERLDAPEFADDLANRSPAELIGELCRDLGLDTLPGRRKPPRRTPDDIAILCAQAAAPAGSGLPQWLAATVAQATENDAHPDIRLKEH